MQDLYTMYGQSHNVNDILLLEWIELQCILFWLSVLKALLIYKQACAKVCIYLRKQVDKIRSSMDGKNVDSVLMELGVRFHRLIYEHLQQFSYSSMGGMLAICDVAEYRKCAKEFKVGPNFLYCNMVPPKYKYVYDFRMNPYSLSIGSYRLCSFDNKTSLTVYNGYWQLVFRLL